MSIVEQLLRAHANVATQDKAGESPLHCAARAGNTPCCRLLMDQFRPPEHSNHGSFKSQCKFNLSCARAPAAESEVECDSAKQETREMKHQVQSQPLQQVEHDNTIEQLSHSLPLANSSSNCTISNSIQFAPILTVSAPLCRGCRASTASESSTSTSMHDHDCFPGGFLDFLNAQSTGKGDTPLILAACYRHRDCMMVLLLYCKCCFYCTATPLLRPLLLYYYFRR